MQSVVDGIDQASPFGQPPHQSDAAINQSAAFVTDFVFDVVCAHHRSVSPVSIRQPFFPPGQSPLDFPLAFFQPSSCNVFHSKSLSAIESEEMFLHPLDAKSRRDFEFFFLIFTQC